ncbi:DEAD/DEAH box helicase [Melghiribacillus thermohalophilus]|nr:DEAD/DEAH box helicase family protein [Melghiribacillus thermohalophilus]
MTAPAFIEGNKLLREPQVEAYRAIYEHFITKQSNEDALVVLPTGTGKTGLMAISPFGISRGRVLIITPQTVVRDSVLGSLDSADPKNFWITTKVFNDYAELPSIIEYNSKLTNGVLNQSDIVVLNYHWLQERFDSSLLKRVPPELFDFIIIDEAHHSEARTWQRALEYFSNAKVLKVTGTPFRSDGQRIKGEEIYSYSLARAMEKGYVKSLEKFEHIPDQMYFTIDHNDEKYYSLEEIREMNLKEEDWINRSVALSKHSNEKIAEFSIQHLEDKKKISDKPHKIIAVACSIKHAEQIKEIYEKMGYKSAIVHSKMEKNEQEKELSKIENHEVDVVINVSMLGEGFDHKYLSIAAIYRPFKTLLPYAQFVGRVLRSIENEDGTYNEEDNIASVIHHSELGLEKLWEYYKKEKKKRDAIRKIKKDLEPIDPKGPKDISYGNAEESEESKIEKDAFIETELLKARKQRIQEENEKIQLLQKSLNVTEEVARDLYRQSLKSRDKQKFLRPDKHYFRTRKDFDNLIRYDIIPSIVADFDLEIDGTELIENKFVLPRKYQYLYKASKNNGALLGNYFNLSLKHQIGDKRDNWEIEDFETAVNIAKDLEKHIRSVLKAKL